MMTTPARLTILIDPAKKRALERLCAAQDLTVSQLVRRLIGETLRAADSPRVVSNSKKPRNL